MNHTQHTTTALGYELKYHTFASANKDFVFVLVHGIGVSHRYFTPFARELAKHGTVYVLDLPGFGSSPRPKTTLSISDFANIIAAWARDTVRAKCVLIGHSMGSQIVSELARRHTDMLSAGVMIGPVVYTAERSKLKQMLRLLQDGLHEPPVVNLLMVRDYIRSGVYWYMKVLPHMIKYRLEDTVQDIPVKVLLVRGEKDPIAPTNWLEQLQSHMPDAKLYEVPDAGHAAMYTHAKQLTSECIRFIAHDS